MWEELSSGIRLSQHRPGEMAKKFRARTALLEVMSSIPNNHMTTVAILWNSGTHTDRTLYE